MHFASSAELDTILAHIDRRDPFGVRDLCLITLARHTGLRVAELVGLDVYDVADSHEVRSTLYVRPAIAKGGRGRILPLNEAARQAITQLLDFNRRRGFSTSPAAPLFINRYHRRLIVRDVQRMLQTLREKAQMTVPVTPHSVRHNFASCVASTSGNLRIVQKLLGHRRLNTSQVYTHPTAAELATAVERLVE
jgi:site-specific recombinase XerD